MAVVTRITSNMVMRNYNSNLTRALSDLETNRKRVETGMKISKSYEDPSAAAKSAILERRYLRNDDYTTNAKNIQNWLYAQDSMTSDLVSAGSEIVENYATSAANDTNQTVRDAYAAEMRSMQKSMVLTLNTKYSNAFIAAGQDGTDAPFELIDNADGTQTLTYRGIDVNAAPGTDDYKKLQALSQEQTFVDLGFGLTDQAGNVTDATALNVSLPGINLVGWGQDADGRPQNVILLAGEMAKKLEEGTTGGTFDREEYGKLWDNFHTQFDKMVNQYTDLGTKEQLVDATVDRLETEKVNLTTQINDTINIDPAEAITDYSWAMYAYNTSLKVGTNIITPSLVDFLQ